jgi:hypothetical protein
LGQALLGNEEDRLQEYPAKRKGQLLAQLNGESIAVTRSTKKWQ